MAQGQDPRSVVTRHDVGHGVTHSTPRSFLVFMMDKSNYSQSRTDRRKDPWPQKRICKWLPCPWNLTLSPRKSCKTVIAICALSCKTIAKEPSIREMHRSHILRRRFFEVLMVKQHVDRPCAFCQQPPPGSKGSLLSLPPCPQLPHLPRQVEGSAARTSVQRIFRQVHVPLDLLPSQWMFRGSM